MGTMASQITSHTIVYSTVYSGTDERKHQNSASLAIVRGIHRRTVNSPHKWPVTRKMFPFDDVIMFASNFWTQNALMQLASAFTGYLYYLTTIKLVPHTRKRKCHFDEIFFHCMAAIPGCSASCHFTRNFAIGCPGFCQLSVSPMTKMSSNDIFVSV